MQVRLWQTRNLQMHNLFEKELTCNDQFFLEPVMTKILKYSQQNVGSTVTWQTKAQYRNFQNK